MDYKKNQKRYRYKWYWDSRSPYKQGLHDRGKYLLKYGKDYVRYKITKDFSRNMYTLKLKKKVWY